MTLIYSKAGTAAPEPSVACAFAGLLLVSLPKGIM
jgi:hypothetical protein